MLACPGSERTTKPTLEDTMQLTQTLRRRVLALTAATLCAFGLNTASAAEKPEISPQMMQAMVAESMRIERASPDVSFDEIIESMKLRANTLNFKLVADLPLSKQIEAMGQKSNKMQILAFCDALIAKDMVGYNLIFAGYLPCRIAVVQDDHGDNWVVTMNMDMMLHAVTMPPEIKEKAQKVRDSIYSIVDAGLNGDL
jgi:uncharacterized protein (DUF302 family)